MIEYDYTINRNEVDEVVTYTPDKIPTKLPNLVSIEGPNSSGKSTLLHMIALSLHGLNKESMNPALKHKMKSLLDNSYQEVKFEFKIQNNDKTLEIISQKASLNKPLIKVYEIRNGKKIILTPERFEKEYNLIYDIPDNPTQRLNQLTESIKWLQQTWGNRIGSLTSNTQRVINDVKNSRDPKIIQELYDSLEKANQNYIDISRKNDLDIAFLDMLEKYTYCRSFLEYSDKYNKLEERIKQSEKKKKKVIKMKNKVSNEYRKLKDEALELMKILEDMYDNVTPTLKRLIPKEEDHLMKIWEMVNFNDSMRNFEFSEKFKSVNLTFKLQLVKLIEKHEETIKEAEIWEKVVCALQEFKTKDIEVPGAGKNISELIDAINESNKEYEILLNYVSNINKSIDLLCNIEEKRNKLETEIFPRLREISGEQDFDLYEDEVNEENDLEKEYQKLKNFEDNGDFYWKECAKKDISLDDIGLIFNEISFKEEIIPYESYSENQLLEKINHLKKSINEDSTTLRRKKNNIDFLDNEIQRLEKKEPHKYQNRMEELTDILKTCQIIKQKMVVKYDRYITEIIDRNYSPDSKDKEREKYFEQVSDYLGKRVEYVKYIDKEYKVKSIDMFNETIQTEDGKIIKLVDMGTGQSQSAYLMGQLNVADNRKIIALFDEVAMMDKKSLTPIFKKFEELYLQDKLLAGVVVQMGDELKIERIGE